MILPSWEMYFEINLNDLLCHLIGGTADDNNVDDVVREVKYVSRHFVRSDRHTNVTIHVRYEPGGREGHHGQHERIEVLIHQELALVDIAHLLTGRPHFTHAHLAFAFDFDDLFFFRKRF